MYDDSFLQLKLDEREKDNALRKLTIPGLPYDFCSNDYLGIVKNNLLGHYLSKEKYKHGSTGSRLLSGNYSAIERLENSLAEFHDCEAGILFNSGYDANIGLLSCVAQIGDTILYDKLSHASIRDGIRLSFANSFSFAHNDIADLEKKIKIAAGNIFIVTESVFSMDGDCGAVREILALCKKYKAHLILDEAHGLGVIGSSGEGLAQQSGLHQQCFARVYTFGKAAGCHGAFIAGSARLKSYLVNFARSLIYTTSMPETSVAAIAAAYSVMPMLINEREHLITLINHFQQSNLAYEKINSVTPIQGIVVPGNEAVRKVAALLQSHGFDIRPILYPTVPKGKERLRIVLHSYNSLEELEVLIKLLS